MKILTLSNLPVQSTPETQIEIVWIAILVVVYGVDLYWWIVPTVYRILVRRVVVIKRERSIKLCTLAFTPPIRIVHREDLGCGYTILAIYRE